MRLLTNAWLWFGLFLIGLYFITTAGLGALHKWVYDTTPALKTSQASLECPTVGEIAGVCNE